METSKITEIALSLLDEPLKALVIVALVFSYFMFRKNSKLLDKVFDQFNNHTKDLKDFNKDMKDFSSEIKQVRDQVIQNVIELNKRISDIAAKIERTHGDQEKYFNKVTSIEKEAKENYGRVLVLEDRIKTTDKTLEVTKQQLYESIKILAKFKEKLPR